MKTKIITKKRILLWKAGVLITLCVLSVNANAEYFLVYGYPEVISAPCAVHHRVISYHHARHHYRHYRHYVIYRRPSSYSITAYYPLPAYAWAPPPCCCCGETTVETVNRVYVAPSYPSGVYYVKPGDRLVGNSWDTDSYSYYGSSQDTGTADNDVY